MSDALCCSCGDPVLGPCKIKKCPAPLDPRCRACHAEKFHGAIPDVTGDGTIGGNPRGGHRHGDPSPWQENNVKLMEDGRE